MEAPLLLMQTGNIPGSDSPNVENFDQMFLRMADFTGLDVKVIKVFEDEELGRPEDYVGVLVTGSPAMVTDEEEWSDRAGRWLKGAFEASCSILAICYGHQLLAHALGGKVDYHPQGMELGTHYIHLRDGASEHPLLNGLPLKFQANLAHSQTITEPPREATVLAYSMHDPHQILAYGNKVLSLQFHPEFDASTMHGYVSQNTGPGAPRKAIRLGIPVRNTPVAASILQRFLNSCKATINNAE